MVGYALDLAAVSIAAFHRARCARLAFHRASASPPGACTLGLDCGTRAIAPGPRRLRSRCPTSSASKPISTAWTESPVFGHGLGSISVGGNQATTLFNAKAMLAAGRSAQHIRPLARRSRHCRSRPARARILGAMHARIFAALRSPRTPRTFLRLAIVRRRAACFCTV